MNEFEFIRQLRDQMGSHTHSARVIRGAGDDAAVIREIADRDLLLTTDLLVENVDFRRDAIPPQLLGHKALAVSLSDIAAMGGRPLWSLVSIGLPKKAWDSDYKDRFFEGYLALSDRFGVTLAGGDVSQSAKTVIDSIVIGEAMAGRAVLRSTARPGDQIFVTGTLGGAAAGLKLIELGARIDEKSEVRSQKSEKPRRSPTVREGNASRQEADGGRQATHRRSHDVSVPGAFPLPLGEGRVRLSTKSRIATGSSDRPDDSQEEAAIESLLLRQLAPQPRVGWGIVLGEEQIASSLIDISDGLSSDLHHLCTESNVGADIDAASLPLDENVKYLCGRRALDPLALALHGGEDFELLFTVARENVSRLPKRVDGVPISRIGEVTDQIGGICIHEKNRRWPLKPEGFTHFKQHRP